MAFAQAAGLTLHYECEGLETGIPLVFVNSLGTDLRLWDEMIPHFSEHYCIVRYDKRGHGLSDCPSGPYTVRDHSCDLARLLENLNLSDVILIGISVGGLISLDYALQYPQQVKAMVLCDTGGKIGTFEFWQERANAIRSKGLEALVDTILVRWFTPNFEAQHPAEYRGYGNMLRRIPAEGYAATCEALRDADLHSSLGGIKAKTLVLCGSEDMATTPQLGQELAAGLPNARFELIENAAHLPCIEQPEAMARKIAQFLQETHL